MGKQSVARKASNVCLHAWCIENGPGSLDPDKEQNRFRMFCQEHSNLHPGIGVRLFSPELSVQYMRAEYNFAKRADALLFPNSSDSFISKPLAERNGLKVNTSISYLRLPPFADPAISLTKGVTINCVGMTRADLFLGQQPASEGKFVHPRVTLKDLTLYVVDKPEDFILLGWNALRDLITVYGGGYYHLGAGTG